MWSLGFGLCGRIDKLQKQWQESPNFVAGSATFILVNGILDHPWQRGFGINDGRNKVQSDQARLCMHPGRWRANMTPNPTPDTLRAAATSVQVSHHTTEENFVIQSCVSQRYSIPEVII